ncbi:hypothetical protein EA472_18385 [Natrarchaeobius oligotrophus]|uniref:Uncharacterized protein n=1 Tax=Natrarchaeobius chitinivorans TaxID=1679083 RepID=A0A3N6MTK8_NATCH|nr:hypothetical protein EA472_18385 [Natrarchaeobius chitinivorans]
MATNEQKRSLTSIETVRCIDVAVQPQTDRGPTGTGGDEPSDRSRGNRYAVDPDAIRVAGATIR